MPLQKTFDQLAEEAKSCITEISREVLEHHLADPNWNGVLIDVREQDEYRTGHIPTAQGIGRGILEYHIAEVVPDTDQEIVLYCRGAKRSALAADSLQTMGYTKVRSMEGGFREWTDEHRAISFDGDPIVH